MHTRSTTHPLVRTFIDVRLLRPNCANVTAEGWSLRIPFSTL